MGNVLFCCFVYFIPLLICYVLTGTVSLLYLLVHGNVLFHTEVLYSLLKTGLVPAATLYLLQQLFNSLTVLDSLQCCFQALNEY
jgi:hypothetical protein